VIDRRTLPSQPPSTATSRFHIPPELRAALAVRGIERFYSHQAVALDALARGEHVLAVTPTASGKSLVYQIPALAAALEDPEARSLFLFPFKALAQDQAGALRDLAVEARPLAPPTAAIYDGDTTPTARKRIREHPPSILLTNPDMLHLSLLPHHEAWSRFFSTLRYVVVDEMHAYRGIFGAHLHHVLRRLRRLCRLHGSSPRFIVASATMANPRAHAESILGVPLMEIGESGAPRAARHFLLLDPPASPYTAAAQLLTLAMDAGLRTIVFTRARRITELIHRWVTAERGDLRGQLASYRAGYLPEERREIEQRLFRGDLLGVVSTSALELGVDIGGLDVCILVGYPGSQVQLWQRVGRVGRREQESLVVLVAMPDALDQYFLRHPDALFGRPLERAVIDPSNPAIRAAHLVCAASEHPLDLDTGEPELLAGSLEVAADMATRGELSLDAEGRRFHTRRRRPQREVDLRSTGASLAIVEEGTQRPIGQIDATRAFHETHPGAIYLHAGGQYEVVSLDRDARKVEVARSAADTYTEVITEKETEILEVLRDEPRLGHRAGLGRLRVTEHVRGYHRRRVAGRELVSTHPLDLPPLVFETVGLWLDLPAALRDEVERGGGDFAGAIHALEHAAIGLFPLLAIADRSDLGGISNPFHPQTGRPVVFIYDGHPGGIGLAAQGFEGLDRLLGETRDLVAGCACSGGCPSCVQSPKCGNGNRPLDKGSALLLLRILTGAASAGRARVPEPFVLPTASTSPASEASTAVVPRIASSGTRVEAPRTGRRIVAFDLETRRSAEEVGGWDQAARMGLALAVVEDVATGEARAYLEADAQALLVDLLSADLVVGYNVKRFDYAVLGAYAPEGALRRVPTLDLLEEIHRVLGFRVKLAAVTAATLGATKSADGLQSLQWFREGRLDLIEEYCRRDVRLTADLYRFGLENGYLLYPDRDGQPMRVRASWQRGAAGADVDREEP
jgi:DEAD/DEAH box helicase domain-containing protein